MHLHEAAHGARLATWSRGLWLETSAMERDREVSRVLLTDYFITSYTNIKSVGLCLYFFLGEP